jgi:hypothetical protein
VTGGRRRVETPVFGFPVNRFGELCAWSVQGAPGRSGAVPDVVFVLLTVVVFAGLAVVVRGLERL